MCEAIETEFSRMYKMSYFYKKFIQGNWSIYYQGFKRILLEIYDKPWLNEIQNLPGFLWGSYFPSKFVCNPDDPLHQLRIAFGKNTL
jgi:hypothetical protein